VQKWSLLCSSLQHNCLQHDLLCSLWCIVHIRCLLCCCSWKGCWLKAGSKWVVEGCPGLSMIKCRQMLTRSCHLLLIPSHLSHLYINMHRHWQSISVLYWSCLSFYSTVWVLFCFSFFSFGLTIFVFSWFVMQYVVTVSEMPTCCFT